MRGLYERFRLLIHEGAKFGIIGVIGVVMYNLVNGLLHFKLHTGPLTAATVAVVVTTGTSYIANRYWSFRHRERTTVPRETVMFFALNGVGLLIQWAVVGFTVYGLGETGKLANVVANNIGIVLGTAFRFWSYRGVGPIWAKPIWARQIWLSCLARPETRPESRIEQYQHYPRTRQARR
jgi:putative flippase GtrA